MIGASPGKPDTIAIACVQAHVTVNNFVSEQSFRELVERLMERAVASMPEGVPRLVVFPEDFASGLIFMDSGETLDGATGLRGAVAALVRKHFTGVMGKRMRHRVGWVRALALYKAQDIVHAYRRVFADVARRHDAYVLGGTVLVPDIEFTIDGGAEPQGGDVFNVAYLFGPDGAIIGGQRKAFLIDLEGSEALDLCAGAVDDLVVYDTALGRIGIAICFDAFQEPVVEHLAALGVDILLQPSANPEPWTEAQQLDWLNGTWKAVVERGMAVYGINPMLVGRLLDIVFEGQSSIIARDAERVAAVAAELGLANAETDADVGAGASADTEAAADAKATADAEASAGREGAGATGGPDPDIFPGGYTALPPRPGFIRVADTATDEEVLTVTLPHPDLLKNGGNGA